MTMLEGPHFQNGQCIKNIVILFHGYGANGDNLIDLADRWQLPDTLVLCPNAPYTNHHYDQSYEWFPLGDLQAISPRVINTGIESIRPMLFDYIEELKNTYKIGGDKIIVGGFSQGGMIALDLLVQHRELRFAISYSGGYYDLKHPDLLGLHKSALLVHGDQDDIIPYAALNCSLLNLRTAGVQAEGFTAYGLGHSINDEGIKRGEIFLKRCLND